MQFRKTCPKCGSDHKKRSPSLSRLHLVRCGNCRKTYVEDKDRKRKQRSTGKPHKRKLKDGLSGALEKFNSSARIWHPMAAYVGAIDYYKRPVECLVEYIVDAGGTVEEFYSL